MQQFALLLLTPLGVGLALLSDLSHFDLELLAKARTAALAFPKLVPQLIVLPMIFLEQIVESFDFSGKFDHLFVTFICPSRHFIDRPLEILQLLGA